MDNSTNVNFEKLKSFFNDILKEFNLTAESTSAVLLDTTSPNSVKEKVYIFPNKLIAELEEKGINAAISHKISRTFHMHKTSINRSYKHGTIIFTWKK